MTTKKGTAKPKVTPKSAKELADKASTSAPKAAPTKDDDAIKVKLVDEPAGDETHLAGPGYEEQFRKQAASPAARKAAIEAGKKDPLEKWGDPKAPVEPAQRAARG